MPDAGPFYGDKTLRNVFFVVTKDINTASLSQQSAIFFAMTTYTLITTNWQPAASVLSYLDKYILFALRSVLVTSVWITIRMLFYEISDDDDDNSVTNSTGATTTSSAQVTLAEMIVWSVVASVNLLGHVFFLIVASSVPFRQRFINATWTSVFNDEKRELEELVEDRSTDNFDWKPLEVTLEGSAV